jgi:hypothetical protein
LPTRRRIRAKAILGTLRESVSECRVISRDIYSLRFKVKHDFLAGRRPFEALLDLLKEKEIIHAFQYDLSRNLTHLFIIPESSLDIAKDFSENQIFLLDCFNVI